MDVSIFRESNEAFIKQTVVGGCEHITVVWVATLFFVRNRPRFDMACYEQAVVSNHREWAEWALLQQFLTILLLSVPSSLDICNLFFDLLFCLYCLSLQLALSVGKYSR